MERKWGRKVHLVFKMRGPRELYLGPRDNPNPEKVKLAIKYVDELETEYKEHYEALRMKLAALLRSED